MDAAEDLKAATDYVWSRPSSFHSGGVNAAYCDGHVTFLNQDIDYAVYAQLMTSDTSRVGYHDENGKFVRPQHVNYKTVLKGTY